MIFLPFLFSCITTRKITIQPYKTFKFEKFVKKDELFKFEFHTDKNEKIQANIKDDQQREILDANTNFTVIHWSPSKDSNFFFELQNPLNTRVRLLIRIPDVNKELYNALGPIKDKDDLAEFDALLKRNIQEQRSYLDSMNEHEELTKSTRRIVVWLILLEIISVSLIVFWHYKKTVSLFEKRQRA